MVKVRLLLWCGMAGLVFLSSCIPGASVKIVENMKKCSENQLETKLQFPEVNQPIRIYRPEGQFMFGFRNCF